MLPCTLTKTSVKAAVTATAATLTSGLDNTQLPGRAVYKLLSTTLAWYAQGIADTVFIAATTDICTAVGHKLTTGDPVQVSNSGGALPTGLSAATTYWAIVLTLDTFKLADSLAHALAGTAIDITGAGSGTQTMTTVAVAGAAGSAQIAAGQPEYLDGAFGAKVSIVRDAADGSASIAALAITR
jgi:hypothetical protein